MQHKDSLIEQVNTKVFELQAKHKEALTNLQEMKDEFSVKLKEKRGELVRKNH